MKGLKLYRNIKHFYKNIPVWYKSDITVNNYTVLCLIKLWYQRGFKVIGDFLLGEDGRFWISFFYRFCLLNDNVHIQIMQC